MSAVVAVSLLTAGTVVTHAGAPGQAGQGAAAPADKPQMTQDVFQHIEVLRDIPVDTFFDSMGMFANAMGNDCTFCHAPTAALDRANFAIQTPRMARARQMIAMMKSINQTYFGGAPRVTCFTCHHGNQSPRSDPNIALQYMTPDEDPNARDFATDTTLSADKVFDKSNEIDALINYCERLAAGGSGDTHHGDLI